MNRRFRSIIKTDEGYVLRNTKLRFLEGLHGAKCGFIIAGHDGRKLHAIAQDAPHRLITALGRMQPKIDETRPFIAVRIAVLAVSDTRSLEDDRSGAALAEMIRSAGPYWNPPASVPS